MSIVFKEPKSDSRMSWTQHAVIKMRQYKLSEQRIRRVLRSPMRQEEAIVPGLVAVMQPTSPTAKKQTEIWVMYKVLANKDSKKQDKPKISSKIKIISCWRYPGLSPQREPPPIPEEILKEIHTML